MAENPPESLPIPKLLNMSQVADILSISKTQAYRLAASGPLPVVRFGKACLRVEKCDLERFIQDAKGNGHAK
jgi:excisionase family DNA binding protein